MHWNLTVFLLLHTSMVNTQTNTMYFALRNFYWKQTCARRLKMAVIQAYLLVITVLYIVALAVLAKIFKMILTVKQTALTHRRRIIISKFYFVSHCIRDVGVTFYVCRNKIVLDYRKGGTEIFVAINSFVLKTQGILIF